MEERGRWRRDDHWYVGKGKMVGVGRWEGGGMLVRKLLGGQQRDTYNMYIRRVVKPIKLQLFTNDKTNSIPLHQQP